MLISQIQIQAIGLIPPQPDVCQLLSISNYAQQLWDTTKRGCLADGHHGAQVDVVVSHQPARLPWPQAKTIFISDHLHGVSADTALDNYIELPNRVSLPAYDGFVE